jgi:hypothetical protein
VQISIFLAGASYPNERGPSRRFEIAICQPGEAVELRPEPNNPADARAIAIYSQRNVKMGYVPAERAALIGTYLRRGRITDAQFQCATKAGGYIRLALDGALIVLPPPADENTPSEFWPDFIPPDD